MTNNDLNVNDRVKVGGAWLGEHATVEKLSVNAEPELVFVRDGSGYADWVKTSLVEKA